MPKFRKKPVVIEAFQWFKNGDHPHDQSDWVRTSSGDFLTEGKVVRYYRHPKLDGKQKCLHCNYIMHEHGWIDTLEGGHIVCPGDWIITGVHSEKYPCKPDIFEETYELVNEDNEDKTLNMGNGNYSGAACYDLICGLMNALSDLSGMQQYPFFGRYGDNGPTDEETKSHESFVKELEVNMFRFVSKLCNSFGFKATSNDPVLSNITIPADSSCKNIQDCTAKAGYERLLHSTMEACEALDGIRKKQVPEIFKSRYRSFENFQQNYEIYISTFIFFLCRTFGYEMPKK